MGLIKNIAIGIISMLLIENIGVSSNIDVTSIATGSDTSSRSVYCRNTRLKSEVNNDVWEISSKYYADYDSIDFVGSKGTSWSIGIVDNSIVADISDDIYIYLSVFDDNDNFIDEIDGEDEDVVFDIVDHLETDGYYWMYIYIEIDDAVSEYIDILITKDAKDNLCFIKSPIYDFNVEQFAALGTDEQSLNENLCEQHDIMWDNPELRAITEKVTGGANNDYEKALAIYKFIVDEFYYDVGQLESSNVVQDDIMLLVRNKVAVCEGFAHVFVGMCRSAGLPSTVVFGDAEDFCDLSFADNLLSNHAWAEVYLDGKWQICDFTWDNYNTYENGDYSKEDSKLDWYLIPLELFSFTHKILNADTVHCIERSGSCGDNATYSITRDGVLTISGSGEIVLPSGVEDFKTIIFDENSCITSIGYQCFIDCDLVETIILPDTIVEIDDEAFYTCEALEYIYIPEGVTRIGESAFLNCDELAYLRIPDSVTDMTGKAFEGCPHLVISIPRSLRRVYFEGNIVQPLSVIVRE